MSNWKIVKLGNLCIVNMGQSPDSNNNNKEGLPFYQGNADFCKKILL